MSRDPIVRLLLCRDKVREAYIRALITIVGKARLALVAILKLCSRPPKD